MFFSNDEGFGFGLHLEDGGLPLHVGAHGVQVELFEVVLKGFQVFLEADLRFGFADLRLQDFAGGGAAIDNRDVDAERNGILPAVLELVLVGLGLPSLQACAGIGAEGHGNGAALAGDFRVLLGGAHGHAVGLESGVSVLGVGLQLFVSRKRFEGIRAFDIGFRGADLEFDIVVQFQELTQSRLGGAHGELGGKLRGLLLQHVGLRLGQILLGDRTRFVKLAVVLEFGLGKFDRGVCRAQVFACGQEAHVGVQHAFLDAAFGLLGGKGRRFLGKCLGFYVQARGAPVPQGVGTGNTEVQTVMVFVIDEGVVVERVLDAGAYSGVVARFRLFDGNVGGLLAELCGFKLQARLFGLLEAVF